MNNMNLNPINVAAQSMASPSQSAQGLASLGRNNDSMLMHVTPDEVQGLQQLAQNMGGSLTTNPQTGLPEAGFLDFLGNLLPTIIGAGLSMTPLGPMGAAAVTGAATGLAKKDLGAGIMAGFGAYGGANLAQGLSNAAGAMPLAEGAVGEMGENVMAGMVPNPESAGNFISPTALADSGVSTWDPTSIATNTAPADITMGNIGQGFQNVTGPGGWDLFKQSMGTEGVPLTTGQAAFKVGTPFAGPVLSAMAPKPVNMEEEDSGWGPFTTSEERRRAREGGTLRLAEGGLAGLYGHGGQLTRGPGDGMSDGIPATIEGNQPARLADGEFVLPADIVSHLGNGSTNAGAKQLYAMMDKLRQARTGNEQQGKQINAGSYLPA